MARLPIIDIQYATVYRGDTRVFSDFSLTLQEGEHVAILGPNGAGKSTFLKLLTGEVHPMALDHTWVRLFGEERWNVWDVRKQLGIVSSDLQRDYVICAEGRNVVLSGFYASNDTYDQQTFTQAQVTRANDVMRELG
ncbi:MAG: ATP-binding cassette domain-containing protein, partial [Nitrospira sp.]